MEAKAQRRLTRDLLKVITNRCRLFSVNVQFKFLALASLHLETIYPERVGCGNDWRNSPHYCVAALAATEVDV